MNAYTTELLARDRIASLESEAHGTSLVAASRDRPSANGDPLRRLMLRLAQVGQRLRRTSPAAPVSPSAPAAGGVRLGQ